MKYIRWFEELSNTDVGIVGGKNASLGELFHALGGAGAPVPAGFAVTAGEVARALRQVTQATRAERQRIPGLDRARADHIVPGAILADTVLRRLGASELVGKLPV